jgi:hypothetical protein
MGHVVLMRKRGDTLGKFLFRRRKRVISDISWEWWRSVTFVSIYWGEGKSRRVFEFVQRRPDILVTWRILGARFHG